MKRQAESDVAITPISWQVLDTLIEKLEGVIGARAMKILKTIDSADRNSPPSPRIVYDLGNELEDLLGKKGAFSLLRLVGREIGQMFTDGKDTESARELLNVTLRHLGFAYEIKLDSEHAYICHCVFYDYLKQDGFAPIERPVCWTGWGFIEGCLKNVNGAHHIKWQKRDNQKKACRFSIRMSADEWDFEE